MPVAHEVRLLLFLSLLPISYSTKAAEGETMPTLTRATRRADGSSIKVEVVGVSR